jgi:hypothetical protein
MVELLASSELLNTTMPVAHAAPPVFACEGAIIEPSA